MTLLAAPVLLASTGVTFGLLLSNIVRAQVPATTFGQASPVASAAPAQKEVPAETGDPANNAQATPVVYPSLPYARVITNEYPPEVLPYNPSEPIPRGYELQQHIRVKYVISGAIVGGLGYGLSAIAALNNTETDFQRRWLFVPVLGPFIGMATIRTTCQRNDHDICDKSPKTFTVLGILGAMQLVGGALFTYGEIARQPRLVLKENYSLNIAPATLGHGGYGISATGTW